MLCRKRKNCVSAALQLYSSEQKTCSLLKSIIEADSKIEFPMRGKEKNHGKGQSRELRFRGNLVYRMAVHTRFPETHILESGLRNNNLAILHRLRAERADKIVVGGQLSVNSQSSSPLPPMIDH